MSGTPLPDDAQRPFVLPCQTLEWRAPIRWLQLGWRDFRRAPGLSLLFGGVIALVSFGVSLLAWQLGRFALLAALLSGFVFVAPLLAVGLYCVSRELSKGRKPHLRDSFQLACRVAGLVNVFFPVSPDDVRAVIEFLLIGSAAGSVFAALTFATAAFSLPAIADRDVDMVTACVSSVNAVLHNKAVMLWWALLIALLTAIGFATAFLGLIVVMPWLAYAAWHGYLETLDASAWPTLD